MATKEMRNYGALGGTGGQAAAVDAATWNKAMADAKAGDVVHVAASTGKNIIKPPKGGSLKNGVGLVFDSGIELWPQQGTGETFAMRGKTDIRIEAGNGASQAGPLDKAGRWGIQLNRRKNSAAKGDSIVSRFVQSSGITFQGMWVESMCETTAEGQGTDYCASAPCFAYNAPTGQSSAPKNITLDHVAALNCTYGYGLCQIAACIGPTFIAIACQGGTCLRPEQQSGTWMRIENLVARGVYATAGNCGFQANPHIEHKGALGMTFVVEDLTTESMGRTYLFNTDGRLDKGSIDGLAVLAGNQAQIAVSKLSGGKNPNSSTDGRTTQAWKRGPTYCLADTGRGVIENADMQVKNVVYSGSFPRGGIPQGSDVTKKDSALVLKADSRWLAGF